MAKRKLSDSRAIYRRLFESDEGRVVMSDLRKFCFATKEMTVKDANNNIDVNAMLINEGRRQVFMQIVNMLKIDYETIYDEYAEEEYG